MEKMSRPYSRLKTLAAKSGSSITEACDALNIATGTIHNWGHKPPRALVQYLDLVGYFKQKMGGLPPRPTQDLGEAVRQMVERYNFSNSAFQIPPKFFRVLNANDVIINPISSPATKEEAHKMALAWAKKLRRYFSQDFTITVMSEGLLAGYTFYFYGHETT